MQSAELKDASREELLALILDEREDFQKKLSAKDKAILEANQKIRWLKRQVFGAKSERLIPQDPRQCSWLDVPEQPPAKSTSVKSYERRAREKPTDTESEARVRFDDSVPVDVTVIFPDEVQGLDDDAFDVIGEKVTERLVQIPTQYRVERTIRKTCKIKQTGKLHTAPAPDAVIERSFADATLLAGMITDKFQYHLPLYRQHQRMKASGVHVSRGHLTRLVHRTLELLEPVYQAILSAIVSSELVSMDEVPIKAGRKEKGKMHTGYLWPVFAEQQVAFVYSSTRAHSVVGKVLGNACLRLLSDGYAAYERYAESRQDLVYAGCWAHVRRYFFEARDKSPPEAEKVLEIIRQLFAIEQELKNCSDEQILTVRRERSMPLVDAFFKEMETLWYSQVVDRSSLLGKAVAYTLRKRFVDGVLDYRLKFSFQYFGVSRCTSLAG